MLTKVAASNYASYLCMYFHQKWDATPFMDYFPDFMTAEEQNWIDSI
jgi:hypothetical protein